MIVIEVERAHQGVPFRDSIRLSQAEFDALTQEQIDAMSEARFQSWVASLSAGEE
jgi:hypothetical protein